MRLAQRHRRERNDPADPFNRENAATSRHVLVSIPRTSHSAPRTAFFGSSAFRVGSFPSDWPPRRQDAKLKTKSHGPSREFLGVWRLGGQFPRTKDPHKTPHSHITFHPEPPRHGRTAPCGVSRSLRKAAQRQPADALAAGGASVRLPTEERRVQARSQRALLVRQRQEVQALPSEP